MKIGLIIIGDEILNGKREDKHLGNTVELLASRGLTLHWARVLGDDLELLTDTFRETINSGCLVFCTGGIGATPDDMTREAAAQATGVPLVRHPEAVAEIEAQFGEAAYPNRILMADLPKGAALIPNPINRIAGFSLGDHHFVPGFPNMAQPMMEWVLDTRYRYLSPALPTVERLFRLFETRESELVPMMKELLSEYPGIRLSSLPSTENYLEIELGVKGTAELVEQAACWLVTEFNQQRIRWKDAGRG